VIHLANRQNFSHIQEYIDCGSSDQTASSGPEHHTYVSKIKMKMETI